jgi:HEAT repeat protein
MKMIVVGIFLFVGFVSIQDDKEKITQLVKDLGAESLKIREDATYQLIDLGDRAKRAVEVARDSTKDPEVRWRAEYILEVISLRERLGDSLWKKLPDKILELAVASNLYERLRVLNEMIATKDKDRRPTNEEQGILIKEILRGVTKKEDKIYVINFVWKNNLKSAGRVLVKLLQDGNPAVRYEAVRAMGMLRIKKYTKEIVKLLKDENARARMNAVLALGQLSAKEYAKEIAKLLKDTSKDVRMFAVSVLSRFSARKYAKDIAKLLNDKSASIRISAIRALGKLSAKEYVKEIIKLLEDDHPGVRINAAITLVKLSAKEALEPLKKRLKKERIEVVRREIKKAIKRIESAGEE